MDSLNIEPNNHGTDLAGSRPIFPKIPGNRIDNALAIPDFRDKRLIFNQLTEYGQVHVYSANCRAGARLRAQLFVPQLPHGGAVVPNFAILAQSLPYSADVDEVPIEVPAGFNAVVARQIGGLGPAVVDLLTRVRYYQGAVVDSKTLVGGRAYMVVWSPKNKIGKYVLQTGHQWPLRWSYWIKLPYFWWKIRGWFGRSRSAAFAAAAGMILIVGILLTKRTNRQPTLQNQEEEA